MAHWVDRRIDFHRINETALRSVEVILRRWLPEGMVVASEYVAKNPTRPDRKAGSFKINMTTGRWADFATGDRGGDITSLAAYLFDHSQAEAALRVAEMLGVDPNVSGS